MARYRLRFLLQEIDLPQGETLLGRSVTCHVTIEDPLVSRRHARIVVNGDRATIEDLGSRNGLFVGERPAVGVVDISAGARIRIGTRELVVCRVSEEAQTTLHASSTGFMIHCASCGFPFASDHELCPHCGSDVPGEEPTDGIEDATLNSTLKHAWSLELLVETVSRAQALDRWQDVERVLLRARHLLEEMALEEEPSSKESIDQLGRAAVALADEQALPEWGKWAVELYAHFGFVPPPQVSRYLANLPFEQRVTLVPTAELVADSAVRNAVPRPAAPASFTRKVEVGAPAEVEPEDDESPRGAGLAG